MRFVSARRSGVVLVITKASLPLVLAATLVGSFVAGWDELDITNVSIVTNVSMCLALFFSFFFPHCSHDDL